MNNSGIKMTTARYTLRSSFRRLFVACLLSIFSIGTSLAAQPVIPGSKADVTVYKTESCGCCSKWTDHLEHSGLSVNVIVVKDTSPVRTRLGVPTELASCHTAVAGDYWVEGHVPADLVSQLLIEQPENIKGLAVPGMPLGSPGMDIPNAPEYKVLSVDSAGKVGLYATREGSKAH